MSGPRDRIVEICGSYLTRVGWPLSNSRIRYTVADLIDDDRVEAMRIGLLYPIEAAQELLDLLILEAAGLSGTSMKIEDPKLDAATERLRSELEEELTRMSNAATATVAQSSVAPDGSSSVAPPGASSSAPRVNAGIGPAPESDDGDDKHGQ